MRMRRVLASVALVVLCEQATCLAHPLSRRFRNGRTLAPLCRISSKAPLGGTGPAKATVAAGGASSEASAVGYGGVAATWGVLGVFYVLLNGLRRLVPIAVEPFQRGDFGLGLWAAYAGFAVFMAYAEGVKGFQKKFCPFVVRRAQLLKGSTNPLHCIFAPFFCMGLFHASKKRKILSWSLLIGVFGIIQVAKRLAYPWNAIVDAGAVVGLGWGCISLGATYVRSLFGQVPSISAELPSETEY